MPSQILGRMCNHIIRIVEMPPKRLVGKRSPKASRVANVPQKHIPDEKCPPSEIQIIEEDKGHIMFDFTNVGDGVANDLRRIMISEVPSMAVDRVVINKNTSALNDESLTLRVAQVPIFANPREFQFKEEDDVDDASNAIRFVLRKRAFISRGKLTDADVTSSDFEWVPYEGQEDMKPPRPVYSDIPIVRLKRGQEIDIEIICNKGIGKIHSNYSPVSSFFFRKLTSDQEESVEDVSSGGKRILKPHQDVCPRDEFRFDIETVGAVAPREILEDAINILRMKMEKLFDAARR